MALIKCAECSSEVSDKAVACPRCGAPVAGASPVNVRTARNPGVAAVLSLFIPGAGQIYNGEIGKGMGFLGAVIALWAFWSVFSTYAAFSSTASSMTWIFGLATVGICIWAITDAYHHTAGASANESQNIPIAPRAAQNRFVTFDCPQCGTTIYQRVAQCMFCDTAFTDEVIDAAIQAYRARRSSR